MRSQIVARIREKSQWAATASKLPIKLAQRHVGSDGGEHLGQHFDSDCLDRDNGPVCRVSVDFGAVYDAHGDGIGL